MKKYTFEDLLDQFMEDNELETVDEIIDSEFLETLPEDYPIRVGHLIGKDGEMTTIVYALGENNNDGVILSSRPNFALMDEVGELVEAFDRYEDMLEKIQDRLKD